MDQLDRTARSRPARLLLAGTLLILSLGLAGAPALAEDDGEGHGRRARPERREVRQRQQAEAMAKLSPLQRQQYFAARGSWFNASRDNGWISCSRPSAASCRPAM
jgi:hypothetical protein